VGDIEREQVSKNQFDLSVCIGSPRQRSALWRFFAPRRSEDLYATCPELESTFKVSIHEKGACHAAFVSAQHAKEAELGWQGNVAWDGLPPELAAGPKKETGRFLEKWRLQEDAEEIATPLHVVVPADYLSVMSDKGVKDRPIVWLPPSRAGTAVALTLAVSKDCFPPGDWPGKRESKTRLVGHHLFASGRTAWIVAWGVLLGPADTQWLVGCARSPVDQERERMADAVGMEISRFVVPCMDEADGTLALWDMKRLQ
jgi:hypothetical protein